MSGNTISRAFELARAGQCRSIEDVRRKLSNEGYEGIHEHLSGSSIKKQLMEAMKAGVIRLNGQSPA